MAMNIFKFKHCWLLIATIWKIPHFKVIPILLLLRTVAIIDAIDLTSFKNIEDNGDEHPICGTVRTRTSAGEVVVTLREGLTLSQEEFSKLYSGKLLNATFSPVTPNCVIQVCGFKSWGSPLMNGFIGSDCDYADCKIFQEEGQAPMDVFDEMYNTSSISCGCQKQVEGCYYNCHKRATEHIHSWGENGCAILYQELACNSCYFPPIPLSIGQNYSTDISHHIRSLLIRDQCTVKQYIPALRRMARFVNVSQPIIHYHYYPIESTMNTSFISEPEHFHCDCGEAPPPTTPPSTRRPPTTPATPSSPPVFMGPVAVGLIAGGITVVILFTSSFILWRRRKKFSDDSVHLEEEDTVSISTVEEFCGNNDKETTEANDNNETLQLHDDNNGISSNDPVYGHQLKTEIVHEVKKVIEPYFLWMIRNQENSRTQLTTAQPTTSSITNYNGINQNAEISMLNQFQQSCPLTDILHPSEFIIPNESFENELGSGLFGNVYKGKLQSKTDGLWRDVAVKRMKSSNSQDSITQMESFLREIRTFASIGEGNENIVKFLGASCYGGKLYILTELCERGSLGDFLLTNMRPSYFDDKKVSTIVDCGNSYYRRIEPVEEALPMAKKPLTEDDYVKLMNICKQITNGMAYLSSKGIVHVDLKGKNILVVIDETTKTIKTIKISDFGLSRKCFNMEAARSLLMDDFPLNSLVPEGITENMEDPKEVSLSVDIWAFACTVWEIFSLGLTSYSHLKGETGLIILKVRDMLLAETHSTECRCHPKPQLAPVFVYKKLLECWNPLPNRRPSFQELHDFFELHESREYYDEM